MQCAWKSVVYPVDLALPAVGAMPMNNRKTMRCCFVLTGIGFMIPLLFLALYL
jgi:hypothetical protein